MKNNKQRWMLVAALGLACPACTESVGDGGGGSGGTPTTPTGEGKELVVEVPATGHAYVRLEGPEVVEGGAGQSDWDLSFSGYDVYTNSGPSGSANAGAFGPLGPEVFDSGEIPSDIPFMIADKLGGAFLGWYLYDGNTHRLWSRYHVHAIKDGGRLWKVQLLGYYGEAQGAPVSALVQLRYAEVTASGVEPTMTVADLNAYAGGAGGPIDAPSECLDLATGTRLEKTPAQASSSSDWHLCFRRETVLVNGELSGPRGTGAIDLNAAETDAEKLEQIQARTPATEQARFDAVDHAALTAPALDYRGDRIISAFSQYWLDRDGELPTPEDGSWVVRAAASETRYIVRFDRFEGATADSPGRVVLRVRREGAEP
ncbi:HmuY family protein [Chondromyces crocatus]|uniref:HmuY protein n=1 Tax=Chondromyces crocatus TaxID=52 RepID=A0A0K1EFR3_CHOCO|nr:HmuY family protein [Chondromyces crocatus]AKT39423.1 uncharacterized protein CMC5_035700 [Chondromyces crocatus]